jgi:predicted dehydrogenase
MSENTLRWGVISTANIGRKRVNPAIQASTNGALIAVASRDASRAKAFAEEGGISRFYGSYEELLADPEIDAVFNHLPNSLHKEWTIRAAESGKHILCEKPMAVSPEECEEMAAAAAANGVKLMEAFMYRFHPRVAQVRELLDSGLIGELKQIRSTFTFKLDRPKDIRWDRDLGGGALMDVGCYCVNVSRLFFGKEPVEVRAMANWGDSGVDEQLAGSMLFDDGNLAHFDCGLTQDLTQVYHLHGTEGHLRIPDAFVPQSEDVVIEHFNADHELTMLQATSGEQYQAMVEHFASCVLNDEDVLFPPGDATLNMKVIQALYRSARDNGAEVEV